jgi:HTH-type transcriptional regulator/antitoxin HigA
VKGEISVIRSRTTLAVPPGTTIREQLDDRSMTQKEFASRMGMSEKHISKLINGEVQLTPDVAVRLESVLGIPARFWNNLEALYREAIIKVKAENEMDEDLKIVKNIPYNEIAKNGWVESTKNPKERVINARKFFEIVHLGLLSDKLLMPGIACRKLGDGEKSNFALITWAQKAKLEARKVSVGAINVEKLTEIIPDIREMTTQNPSDFCPALCEKLSGCGVALIFLPHISRSFLHSATFYDGAKIVIGITVRGKDADKFWFSLFHEIGHIVLGHVNQTEGTTEKDENTADEFARETLIPSKQFITFTLNQNFNKSSIISFAKKVGIDVGIVVGRLQKENFIHFDQYNYLKTKYKLTA